MKEDISLKLYRKMYLIRQVEEKIRKYYEEDEMKTPVHLYVGAEAITTGVCEAAGKDIQIIGTYRSHGLYLFKTEETTKFFAEMYGKQNGIAKGKAGSMHLSAPDYNFMGSSAIVASAIPVATGVALANKYKGDNIKTVTFFGDGAIDEGVFWESINFACLKKLPVIFVCEDNNLAIHTNKKFRHGYDSIGNIISKFRCNVFRSDTTDVEEIMKLTLKAIDKQNANKMPVFLHLKYYRYYQHTGMYQDFDAGYRDRKEFEEWFKKDPINKQREKLKKKKINKNQIQKIEKEIEDKIENSIQLAKYDKFPSKLELLKNIYA